MIIKIIKLCFNTKFVFFPPKKSQHMMFDTHSERILSKIFKLKYFVFLETRKKEINLFILLKTFLKCQFSFFDYLINYIDYCGSKLIITSIDNNLTFYKIKSRLNVTTIFFQNGVRMGHGDIFSILSDKKKLNYYKSICNVDLMCVFNEITGKTYQKFILGKVFLAGSILSNKTRLSKSVKKELTYISLYRPKMSEKLQKNYIKLVKILNEYCINRNLKLRILGRHNKNSLIGNNEKLFYNKILKKNFSFIPNHKKRKTYTLIDKSKIIISSGSTIGIESLGRKNKTVLINPLFNIFPFKKNFFGYFTKQKDLGFFWYSGLDEKIIIKTIDKVLNFKEKKWEQILKKYKIETSIYDYNNKKLKEELIRFLESKKLSIRNYLK
jgi:surface carbohydrate biosynthesis protein